MKEDEITGRPFGQTTHRRCGMKALHHLIDIAVTLEGETEVAAQMHEVGSSFRERSLLFYLSGVGTQLVHDV